jgi:lipopolysaccharide/colanic/teichoic acid biosynthesis glycosyltransferase
MMSSYRSKRTYRAVKRLADLTISAMLLILFSPIMLALAIAIWLRMGRPVLFRQVRPGLHERPFTVYKFRTMTNERGAEGQLRPDIERITPLGTFMRRTSLDELPQLFNVLKGEMSLVGPRPLLVKYLPYYTERERLRHTVRPGITGLAQVSGRNLLGWDDRLETDARYVERQSLWLDLWILYKTALNVVQRRGVVVVPGTRQQFLSTYRENQKRQEEQEVHG